MENITHVTRQGSKEFCLTNTNKLLRSYDGCIGLKTGSTSLAKYCVSAVASRNNITLISVVMAAPDYKVRFKDAAAMLKDVYKRQESDNQAIVSAAMLGAKKNKRHIISTCLLYTSRCV